MPNPTHSLLAAAAIASLCVLPGCKRAAETTTNAAPQSPPVITTDPGRIPEITTRVDNNFDVDADQVLTGRGVVATLPTVYTAAFTDRKSTRLNSSHERISRM